MAATNRVAEVIEASTTRLVAQCYDLYDSPPLGTLVRAGLPEQGVYAVVTGITTQGADPGRKPIARGAHAQTEDQVYQEHPQLTQLLHTHLEAAIIGHTRDGRSLPHLPPTPPRVHAFVYVCSPEEVRMLTASLEFLRLLLSDASPSTDEAAISLLTSAAHTHPDAEAFRTRAGRQIARLLGGDISRLNSLLGRLSSVHRSAPSGSES